MISTQAYWRKVADRMERNLEQGYTARDALSLGMSQTELEIIQTADSEAKKLLRKLGIEAAREFRRIDDEIRKLLDTAQKTVKGIPRQIDANLWTKAYLKPDERKELMEQVRGILGLQ